MQTFFWDGGWPARWDGAGMVLLNGSLVKAIEIEPALHLFIGTFRMPNSPQQHPTNESDGKCPGCQESIGRYQSLEPHWQKGCFDLPQYIDMQRNFTRAGGGNPL